MSIEHTVISVQKDNLASEKFMISERIFGCRVNESLIHEALRVQMRARRQGSACAKTTSEVRGGGKKPWRQKGTGRARTGSIRSIIWKDGGVGFPPRPRSFELDFPREKRKIALRQVLSDKRASGTLLIIKDIVLEGQKTKDAFTFLKTLGVSDSATLIYSTISPQIRRAFGNIRGCTLISADTLNIYDIIARRWCVITVDALKMIEESIG